MKTLNGKVAKGKPEKVFRLKSTSVFQPERLLAETLNMGDELGDVNTSVIDVCREFAFSSDSVGEFAEFYLASEVFSKWNGRGSVTKNDREAAALVKFREAEQLCLLANDSNADLHVRTRVHSGIYKRAKALLSELLQGSLNDVVGFCQHGPGASTSLRRSVSNRQNKWENKQSHITGAALPYFDAFRRYSGWNSSEPAGWYLAEPAVVSGNRVTTVPKSYKTDRTIAIEPDWNMFFQKGVGGFIRHRLQRRGILRQTAQAENRLAALRGSENGDLATIDLKMASDSVSILLCESLLPPWLFKVLMDLRSPVGELPNGDIVVYEKISSMGNGSTFELETAIFWSLAQACCGTQRVYVYGDDIIVPTEFARLVLSVLTEVGFLFNENKTFVDGPFRESCGGHYFAGSDVTPFYLRHPVETINDSIVLHNHLVTWFGRRQTIVDGQLSQLIGMLRSSVPRCFWGPYQVQGVLWAEWDECRPKWSRSTQSYRQHAVSRVALRSRCTSQTGALRDKLVAGNVDHESSWLTRSTSREKISRLSLDRDAWYELPVRIVT